MALGSGEMADRESGFGGGSGGAPGSFRAAQDIGFDPQTGAFNAFAQSDPYSLQGLIQRGLNEGISLRDAARRTAEPSMVERLAGALLFDRLAGPQLGLRREFAIRGGEPGYAFSIDPIRQVSRIAGMGNAMAGGSTLGVKTGGELGSAISKGFSPEIEAGFTPISDIRAQREQTMQERRAGVRPEREDRRDLPSERREERQEQGRDLTPLFAALYMMRRGLI